MTKKDRQKSESRSVSLYPEEWDFVEEVTRAEFKDRSAFFRAAIDYRYKNKKKIYQLPNAHTRGVLEKLAFDFRPSVSQKIQTICKENEINQEAVLEALLAALPDYLATIEGQSQYYIELISLGMANRLMEHEIGIHSELMELKRRISRFEESRENELMSHPEFAPIAKRDLAAAAGDGAVVEDESVDGHIFFRRDWLQKNGLDPDLCCSIIVTGESMEPTLPEGSTIVVNCSIKRQHNGRIYVIRTSDGLVVKRAGKSEDGGWLLISDHPAHSSVPWPDDAEVVGEVVWGAQTFL